jgi:hypothetical protein
MHQKYAGFIFHVKRIDLEDPFVQFHQLNHELWTSPQQSAILLIPISLLCCLNSWSDAWIALKKGLLDWPLSVHEDIVS